MDDKTTQALSAGVSLLKAYGISEDTALIVITNIYALGKLHGQIEATRGSAVEGLRRLNAMECKGSA